MKKYKKVFVCICVVDVLYAATNYIVAMHSYSSDGVVFYVVRNVFDTDVDGRFLLICLSWFMAYLIVLLTAVPFVFRYCDVCLDWTMGPVSFAWLVSFELLIAFFTALNQYVAWSPVAEHTAKTLQTPVSEDVLPLFEDNRKVSQRIASALAMFLALAAFHYAVIVLCGYRVWHRLSMKKTKAKRRIRRAMTTEAQLGNAFIAQAFLTAIIIAIPAVAYSLMLALDASWNAALLELTSRTLSLLPVVNAACAIVFLKPYRQALRSFFCAQRDCKTAPSEAFTVTVKSTTMSISAITDSRPNTKVKFGLASTIYY
ncbi:hypothetical protein AAVH_22219 [Aphelenchoides avenae]|nr:hypothetical protein AAVH_22219 [Aphelenchus avenae]